MKLCLFFSLILLICSAPAFGQLSTKEIEAISNIVKESEARMKEYVAQEIAKVNVKIDALDQRLTTEIGAIEKRFEGVNERFEGVNERFENMDKRLDDINKRLDNHFSLLLGLVGFIAVVIGIPQIIVALQRKHQRVQDEKIEQQYQQIQVILEEIKTLRQKRIINS